MNALTEGTTAGDFLLFEADGHYSREEVTITGGDYEPGTVLGQIAANEKYTRSVESASDGAENAVAVLLTPAKAETADVKAVAIKRHARVRRGGLLWDPSYDDTAKRDAAMASLKDQGILSDV